MKNMPASYENFDEIFNAPLEEQPTKLEEPQQEASEAPEAEAPGVTEEVTEEEEAEEVAEGEEQEEEEPKQEQTLEERAKHASRSRRRKEQFEAQKKQLEETTEQNQQMLAALKAAGVNADTVPDALKQLETLQQAAAAQQAAALQQQMQTESEETGVPLEFLQARQNATALSQQNETLKQIMREQKAAAVYEADKALVESVDPEFFTAATQQQKQAFGALRLSGFDALTAHSYVMGKSAPQAKEVGGTEHMKPLKGKTPGASAIPESVLNQFEEYGMSREQAKTHMKTFMKGK